MGEIDYVVPMVFPDDPLWRKDMQRAGISFGRNSARWRSWGTEELLIRLVRKNMPWLHDIIILLARESQRQPWMKDVRVVYHREFIPQSLLPLFNVNTIEMYLHQIPGLSERFIYGNDDMFPLSPLAEEDFFRGGLPCQHMTESAFPNKYNIFHLFVREGLNMIAANFDAHYENTYLTGGHSLAPILKSSIVDVWRYYGKRIARSFTVTRSVENFNQYIFSYWQHFTGMYVDHVHKRTYTNALHPPKEVIEIIGNKNAGVVCINDSNWAKDIDEISSAVRTALEKRLQG